MRRLGVLLAVAWLWPAFVSTAPGKVIKEVFETGSTKVTYYLFVPPQVTASSPAPLIVLLHGSGRDGSTLVEPWRDLAAKEGIILVGPDAQDPRQWKVPDDGPDAVCALVTMLKERYAVNPRRVYLFGHSGGAVAALYLSMLESEFFAATAIHAGAWRSPAEFGGIEYARRKIPIAIFVGDQDPFFPVSAVNATRDALKERSFPIEVTVIKGHDHNYYGTASKTNAAAWAFLKGRALESDPKFEQHNFVK
jgi:poly(3-hydroxybutyrate) depolymerase